MVFETTLPTEWGHVIIAVPLGVAAVFGFWDGLSPFPQWFPACSTEVGIKFVVVYARVFRANVRHLSHLLVVVGGCGVRQGSIQ